ncbi:uncharacterized protein [Epargyreus clarus]|uniref:uncharacterized protein n=1 Tax=Epargyreus clarus TaxID=520877 RepID=UPI003C2F0DF7
MKPVQRTGSASQSCSCTSCLYKTNAGKFRHHDSQVGSTITRDQGSEAGNLLKRCFCTLQLQKSSRQRKKMRNPGINVQYPQTVTIGRVSVEPFNKKILKTQRVCTQDQACQIRRSKSTDPKIMNNLRTVSTKIDKKHLPNKKLLQSDCYPSSCPNYEKRSSLKKQTKNDMQTILPYTPSKFNKKESKTIVSDKDKLQKINNLNQLTFENDNKLHDTMTLSKGRRLTAKKSKKSIPANKLDRKSYLNNSIFCRCARLFSKRTGTEMEPHDNHVKVDTLRNEHLKIVVTPKKAKSVKLPKAAGDDTCPVICRKTIDGLKKKYSMFPSGDAQSNIMKRGSTKNLMLNDLQSKSVERKSISKSKKMKVTFADSTKYPPSMTSESKKKFIHHGSKSKLCYSCSVNNCPLLSQKIQTDKEKSSVFHRFTNRLSKTSDRPITYSESADNCQYCELCKKKLEADEINKGAGDREVIDKTLKKSLSKKKRLSGSGDKRLSVASQHKARPCPCGKENPMLEMRVDAVNYDIINKQEVLQRVNLQGDVEPSTRKKDKHGDSCNCCKCTQKRLSEGAKISVPAKGISKITGAPGKTLVKKGPAIAGPCICGSIKCAIESKRTKSKTGGRAWGFKPCVCGSDVCARETKKMKKLRARYVCTCKEEMDRRRAEREILNKIDVQRRLLIAREKDEKRRRKRIKRNAELEKRVKKYKDASDTLLAADSLIDVGKLGMSTVCDVARTTARAIYDPKVALERVKCKKTSPDLALQLLEKRYMESDAAATARRLKLRCMFMKSVKKAKQKLEENPITHYMLHAADKNAKARKFKRKPKVRRVREPLDFECSLYMASLRKRPCLSIYYKWPWFYPHLVTMLNIWKQFTDVTLFLLAAVVWSPCILCMEGCRAMMCCFFCTG